MAKDEILVVGAGPVGLVMASELMRHGVKCRVIDKNSQHAADSRAVGVQPRTLEVYEDMGIINQALELGRKISHINLHSNGKQLIHTQLKNLDSRYNFILNMPQSLTEPMLSSHLESYGASIERDVELTSIKQYENYAEATLIYEKERFIREPFAYIIGCDGARSICRHLMEISFPGDELASPWAVFDTEIKWPYNSDEMHLFLHEKGISACFPLPNNRMRVTCELPPTQQKIDYPDVLAIMHERISKDLKLIGPKDLSPFIIHHRQAKMYHKGRVFLAGDAAHIHSPAGGQGMNTGIQDAYNLAWKLALVQKGFSSKDLLDSYFLERYPIAKWVLSATDRLTKMMTTKNSILVFLRNSFLSLIGHIDAFKLKLPKQFSQLYLQYKHNNILYRDCLEHHPQNVLVGYRAPDHSLKSCETKMDTRLFKLFQGTHHTLLLFLGKNPPEADLISLNELYSFVQNHYGALIHPYFLLKDEKYLNACQDIKHCFIDNSPSVHSHYGIEVSTGVLVRPDGYVGFANQPPSIKGFEMYLKTLFDNFNP